MPDQKSTQSKISIQDIVIYGNKPTTYNKILILEEGTAIPTYDSKLLIIQKKNNQLCFHRYENNQIKTHFEPLDASYLQQRLSQIEGLPKDQVIEVENTPDNPIKELIRSINSWQKTSQDIAPTGEYNDASANINTQEERLYQNIENLIQISVKKHKSANCDKNGLLRKNKENNITRLITNEFSFYTKKPITLKSFEELNQKILTLAAEQPENFHLVLSSFAVQTPNNKVMNVVVHIACGKKPKLNLIVKNHPSDIDPVYTQIVNGRRQILQNFDINKGDHPEHYSININGGSHEFSFDNVLECQTPNGQQFYSCIDICSDHARGVAKNNLIAKLQAADKKKDLDSIYCTHIVTSNFIRPQKANIIAPLTHADPIASHKACRQGEPNTNQKKVKGTVFGTEQNITITPPMKCSHLPESVLSQLNTSLNLESFIHRSLAASKLLSSKKTIQETATILAAHLKEKNIENLNKIDIEALKAEYQSDFGAFNLHLLEMTDPTLDNLSNKEIPTLIKDNDNIWIYGNDSNGHPQLTQLQLGIDDSKLLKNLPYSHPATLLMASEMPNETRELVKTGHTHIKPAPSEQVNKILLDAFTKRANKISNIIASDILHATSIKHQKKIFNFYMAVMKQSYEIGDIETAITIGNALTQQPVYRLEYLRTKENEALIQKIQFIGRKENTAEYTAYKKELLLNKVVVIDSTPKFKFELAQLEGKPTAQTKAQGLDAIFGNLLPQGKIFKTNPEALDKINFEDKEKNHIILDEDTLYKLSKNLYSKTKDQAASPDFSKTPPYTSVLLAEEESRLAKINRRAEQAMQGLNVWRRNIPSVLQSQRGNTPSFIPDETIHDILFKNSDKTADPETRLKNIIQGLNDLILINENTPESTFVRALSDAIIAQKNTTVDQTVNIDYVLNNACTHCRHEGVSLSLILTLESKYAQYLNALEHPHFFNPRKLASNLSDIPDAEMRLILDNLSPEEKEYLSKHDPQRFQAIEKLEHLHVKTRTQTDVIPVVEVSEKRPSPILTNQLQQSEQKDHTPAGIELLDDEKLTSDQEDKLNKDNDADIEALFFIENQPKPTPTSESIIKVEPSPSSLNFTEQTKNDELNFIESIESYASDLVSIIEKRNKFEEAYDKLTPEELKGYSSKSNFLTLVHQLQKLHEQHQKIYKALQKAPPNLDEINAIKLSELRKAYAELAPLLRQFKAPFQVNHTENISQNVSSNGLSSILTSIEQQFLQHEAWLTSIFEHAQSHLANRQEASLSVQPMIPSTKKEHSTWKSPEQSRKRKATTFLYPHQRQTKKLKTTQEPKSEISATESLSVQSIADVANNQKKLEGANSNITDVTILSNEQSQKMGVMIAFKTDHPKTVVQTYAMDMGNDKIQFSVQKNVAEEHKNTGIQEMCRLAVSVATEATVFNVPPSSTYPQRQRFIEQCFKEAIQDAIKQNKFPNGAPTINISSSLTQTPRF